MKTVLLLAPALFLLLAPGVQPQLQDAGAAPAPPVPTVLEESTEIPFPLELRPSGVAAPLVLAGMGVRTKTIFNVKVYAFGLYLDAAAATEALAKWKGVSLRKLQKNDAFYARLLKEGFTRSLRLVMARDVDGEDMRDAFEDSLAPRIRRAAREKKQAEGAAALEKFKQYFSVDEVTEGTELVFTWLPGGRLATRIKGKDVGVIESPALCWALYDVYLGPDPISKKAKRSVIARLPELLEDGGRQAAVGDALESLGGG